MSDNDIISQILARSMPSPIPPPPLPKTAAEILRAKQAPKLNTDPMAIAKNAVDLVDDQQQLLNVIQSSASDLDNAAPETAQDVRNTMSRALFFLASKAPKESFSAPGMPPMPPPKQDVLRFQRYIRAIDDPMTILDDAEAGMLSPEAVEAVKTVYPSIFETIQTEIADRVKNAPKIPYARRMQISALLGQDMTGTLSPSMITMAQSVYGNAPPEEPKQQLKAFQGRALGADARAARETTEWRKAQEGIGSWNRIGRRTR